MNFYQMKIGDKVRSRPGALSGKYVFALQNSVGTIVDGPHIRYSYYTVVFPNGLTFNFTEKELEVV